MIKALLRSALERVDQWLVPLAARQRHLASLYYLLTNPRFHREHRSVAAGRARFNARKPGRSDPMLRRNIHRLEKGLLMRPRHSVFASDYIEATVDAYLELEAAGKLDPVEQRWAHDVLCRYFTVVQDTATISAARRRFGMQERRATEHPWSPRPSAQRAENRVSFEAFRALCQRRRSVRWFLDKPVPNELLEQALDVALQAPSACNRQPFFFRVLEGREQAGKVARIAMGTKGYADQIPTLLVLLGDLSCFPHERDRHLPYIDGSLAAMQLMLALETLGLSSCPINWPDVESLERRMAKELDLPPWIRPVMLIAIGYADPDGEVAYSAKKPAAQLLRRDNRYVD
jgi:nitroreductase